MVDEGDLKTYQLGGVAEGIDTLADEIEVFRIFRGIIWMFQN